MNKLSYRFFTIFFVLIFVLIFALILAFIYHSNHYDNFFSKNSLDGYRDNVFAIRPPNDIAYLYNPNKLAPIKILKDKFIYHPIEGFSIVADSHKKSLNLDTLENGMDALSGGNPNSDVKYPSLSEDNKNVRKMIEMIDESKNQFKFFPTKNCDENYYYTGASFNPGTNGNCGNNVANLNKFIPAKVIAKLCHDRINDIQIIDNGLGYKNPKIKIIANDKTGNGAKASVTALDDLGSIMYIEINEKGQGYTQQPTILIEDDNQNLSTDGCYLCAAKSKSKTK